MSPKLAQCTEVCSKLYNMCVHSRWKCLQYECVHSVWVYICMCSQYIESMEVSTVPGVSTVYKCINRTWVSSQYMDVS